MAREGSNRPFADIGISSGHHDLTHHKNSAEIIEKVQEIDRWYVQRLARVPREDGADEGRRWAVTAAQLDDPVRLGQCRRQPPHARQPADPAGRRRRRRVQARPLREGEAAAADATCSSPWRTAWAPRASRSTATRPDDLHSGTGKGFPGEALSASIRSQPGTRASRIEALLRRVPSRAPPQRDSRCDAKGLRCDPCANLGHVRISNR